MICTRSGGVRFKCACCRKPFSARRGTVLERSNIDTAAWLRAMALFLDDSGRGLPARIQRACGVSYKTAWSMTQRLMAAPDDPILRALRDEQGEPPPCHPDPFREDRRLP
jgi:transposase-like protein